MTPAQQISELRKRVVRGQLTQAEYDRQRTAIVEGALQKAPFNTLNDVYRVVRNWR